MIPNLLSISDFEVHPLRIPTDNDFGNDNLNDIITTFQNTYIRKMLGFELYKNFKNDFSGGEPQTQKYIDLLDGVTYTYNGKIMEYSGLINILKGFVYYEYTRYLQSYITAVGQVTPNQQNSTKSNIANYAVNAWNESIDLLGFNGNEKLADTLYNFLTYNSAIYTEYKYNKNLRRINVIGI